MKNVYLPSLLIFVPHTYYSQINQSSSSGSWFRTDVDTRYGEVSSLNIVDEWILFVINKTVTNITHTATYITLLQNNKNTSFTRRMSVPVSYAAVRS